MKNLSLSFVIFLTSAGPLVSYCLLSCFKALKNSPCSLYSIFAVKLVTSAWGKSSLVCSDITLAMWGYYCKHQIQNAVKWMQRNNQWPFFHVSGYRGYYIAAQRHEISLWVLQNISWVSEGNKWNIFQHEKSSSVSPSGHVMFYLVHKHQWNTKPFHLFFM